MPKVTHQLSDRIGLELCLSGSRPCCLQCLMPLVINYRELHICVCAWVCINAIETKTQKSWKTWKYLCFPITLTRTSALLWLIHRNLSGMREVSYLVTTAWLCYVMNPFSFTITLEENKNGESQNVTISISPLGQSIHTGTCLTIMGRFCIFSVKFS